jgi:hypothetical protein
MSIFFRAIEALFPRGNAFTLALGKILTKYVEGLAAGAPEDFRDFAFQAWEDLFPDTTTQLEKWRDQFGLFPAPTPELQVQSLKSAWAATGGQGLDYLQGLIDAAGFAATVHASLDPLTDTYRNPLDYLPQRSDIGQIHCGGSGAYCGDPTAVCSGLQGAIQGHIVNQDLSGREQPPISDDPATFPFWIYVGGEIFGTNFSLPQEREIEFQSLILSAFPGTYWIGYLVDRISGELLLTEDDEPLLTEAGEGLTLE